MALHPEKLSLRELQDVTGFDSNLVSQIAQWANKNMSCAHCGKCELSCEVLKGPQLDMGTIEKDYQRISGLPLEERIVATRKLMDGKPELYHALRSCCFCGFCTAECQRHMAAPDRMREWRGLFMEANLMPPQDSKLVFVDEQWNIFSAYRAVYGIAYPEFASLEYAATVPGVYDTLFFPGCSLVSYAPELTRQVMNFLQSCGIKIAMSDACCGSPLMSAGLFERGTALREGIREKLRAAGIHTMITVCPGCGEEFAETFGDEIEIIPLPEILLQYGHNLESYRATLNQTLSSNIKRYSAFDSCHDRASGRHGRAIRACMSQFVPEATLSELDHHGRDTLCCGAGGAVAGYNDKITNKRIKRVIREAQKTKCDTLVTMCPTCTYTVGNEAYKGVELGFNQYHYLEILFENPINWNQVFGQLNGMWYGEYAQWLTATFFS